MWAALVFYYFRWCFGWVYVKLISGLGWQQGRGQVSSITAGSGARTALLPTLQLGLWRVELLLMKTLHSS